MIRWDGAVGRGTHADIKLEVSNSLDFRKSG